MKIKQEIKYAWRIFKSNNICQKIKAWYITQKRGMIIGDCLETPEGRTELARAMVEPLRVHSHSLDLVTSSSASSSSSIGYDAQETEIEEMVDFTVYGWSR